jgi:hypothetical protein
VVGASPPHTLIVKIGSVGDVHLDLAPSTVERMKAAVAELNQAGGVVIYYRESPYQDASELASATFKQLGDLKPRILLGTKAPSEWGVLDWVEVQRNPHLSRIFFARGQKFLMSAEQTAEQPKQVVRVGGPLQPENEDRFFKEIDLLIRADRVLEAKPVSSELAMEEKAAGKPSLHLRLAYASRRWASVYPADDIPSNVDSFYRDLWWLVERTFSAEAWRGRKVSGETAQTFLDEAKRD